MSRNAVSFMAVRRGPVRTQAVPDPDDTRPQAAPDSSVPEAPVQPDAAADVDAQAAALIQDGATLDAIVEWATGNPDRITAALAADAASANPRKTLPARLAPTKENG